jgi:putative tryptophan/tyrosine transport system substrate-binding protein
LLTDNSLLGLADTIVSRAMRQRVPVFASMSYAIAQAGALINYSRDPNESFQAVARLLNKILNGANPADLPVKQPTKYILSINLKTAKLLGITISPTLLARADEVIE